MSELRGRNIYAWVALPTAMYGGYGFSGSNNLDIVKIDEEATSFQPKPLKKVSPLGPHC